MSSQIEIQRIIEAAEAGGRIIANYFGTSLDIEEKSAASDVRTKADTEAEDAILTILRQYFPGFSIYAEETGKVMTDSPYCFVIDPLDGSHNFVLGIPFFSVSIALTHKDEIVAGVIYQPITNKAYSAQAGTGAYADTAKIQVSKETALDRATISMPYGYETPVEKIIQLESNMRRAGIMRMMNSWSSALDLCLLAEGKIESIIIQDAQLYDVAAGKTIAREAGAIITDIHGGPDNDTLTSFIVSCNQTIHDHMLGLLPKD